MERKIKVYLKTEFG